MLTRLDLPGDQCSREDVAKSSQQQDLMTADWTQRLRGDMEVVNHSKQASVRLPRLWFRHYRREVSGEGMIRSVSDLRDQLPEFFRAPLSVQQHKRNQGSPRGDHRQVN
jgi:hypothetical protein